MSHRIFESWLRNEDFIEGDATSWKTLRIRPRQQNARADELDGNPLYAGPGRYEIIRKLNKDSDESWLRNDDFVEGDAPS